MQTHNNEETMGRFVLKRREPKGRHQKRLQEKMEELIRIKEELKNAKDSTAQSWLASRPLVVELETLQLSLAIAKDRTSAYNAVISELQSQLEAINKDIEYKADRELEAKKMTEEITVALDGRHKELEMIKKGIHEERSKRSKLKQVRRMRRQTVKTLQAKIRAVETESEAFAASAAEAIGHIKNSETDNNTVQLTQEEYHALRERANEETAVAEWRISLFMKQKLAAEGSQNLYSSTLKALSKKERRDKEINEVEEQQSPTAETAFPKVRDKATNNFNQNLRKPRRRSISSNKKAGKQKKPNILIQIRSFLARSLVRLF